MSDNKHLRIKQAEEELSKKETNHNDKSKNYIICKKCIETGLTKGKGHRTYTQRRDSFSNHLKVVHNVLLPSTLFEFNLSEQCVSEKQKQKQTTLNFSTAPAKKTQPKRTFLESFSPSDDLQDGLQDEPATKLPSTSQSFQGQESILPNTIENESPSEPEICDLFTETTDEVEDIGIHENDQKQGLFFGILNKILRYIISIHTMLLTLTSDCKRKETLPAINEHLFGNFWCVKKGEIQFDKDAFSAQWRKCLHEDDISFEVPFLNVDVDEELVTCSFCPTVRLKLIPKCKSVRGFFNSKSMCMKHCLSNSHLNNVSLEFKNTNDTSVSKQESAGMNVFQCVYGGMKEGFSLRQIQRELSLLFTRNVKVGNINHSNGTLSKIKKVISGQVKELVKIKLATTLKCTGRLRPVQETVDKMTHNHITSQMQVCIAPLMNNYELFTPIYTDCSPVAYVQGSYKHLVKQMREKGNLLYDPCQVEGAAADGAYIKANVHCYFNSELEVAEGSTWIPFQWDVPHQVDLCDGKSMDQVDKWQKTLRDAQTVTKVFTHGKEHQGLIELVDIMNVESCDGCDESVLKLLSPVVKSNLKFAAHGFKFLKNYINNLPIYIQALNKAQNDNNHTLKQREMLVASLKLISLEHVTLAIGLMDYYDVLSKAQHGSSQVNQLCWEFYDHVHFLEDSLENMTSCDTKYWPCLNKYMDSLKVAEIQHVPLQSEEQKNTRKQSSLSETEPLQKNQDVIADAFKTLSQVCLKMKEQLEKKSDLS